MLVYCQTTKPYNQPNQTTANIAIHIREHKQYSFPTPPLFPSFILTQFSSLHFSSSPPHFYIFLLNLSNSTQFSRGATPPHHHVRLHLRRNLLTVPQGKKYLILTIYLLLFSGT